MSSAHTPKSAGSALMIGKIALILRVAAGMRCQNKLSPLFLPLIECEIHRKFKKGGALNS